MKNAIPYCMAAVFAVALAALAAKNRALRADLEDTRAALAALKAAPPPTSKAERPKRAPRRPPRGASGEAAFDKDKFDKAVEEQVEQRVEERVAQREAQREAEREARRRAWENETDEQREARRQEFHARIKEHAAKQLAEFIEKTHLDENQQAALEGELGVLDSRIREISEEFAAAVDEGLPFAFETQMQLLNNISTAVLDAYDGLDASLPEGWRESDDGFVVMMGINPDSGDALFRSLIKAGVMGRGPGGPFGGPPPR